MSTISIFACESQPVVVEGLIRIFTGTELTLAGHATGIGPALEDAEFHKPDVLLIGQPLGCRSILPLVHELERSRVPGQPVLWADDLAGTDRVRAWQMGARGIIRRTDPVAVILQCLRRVAAGHTWLDDGLTEDEPPCNRPDLLGVHLTRREKEVLELLSLGLRNRQIAERMCISPGTVKVHLMHIFEKTSVADRFELALHARSILRGETQGEPKAAAMASTALTSSIHFLSGRTVRK